MTGRPLHGRMKWHGLDISIENAAGTTRSGVDADGKPWSVTMTWPYGYIRLTLGVDGDHVDCFVGPDASAEFVYVIHQHVDEKFDEDKCMLNWPDAESAKAAFLENYSDPKFFHSMTVLPVDEFIEKVKATRDNPQKITASERALMSASVTRELLPHEVHHDFSGHAKRQDSTQTAVRRILGSVKPHLIREAARRAAMLSPATLESLTMPFDRHLAARISKSLEIAHTFGYNAVYAERYRATGRPKSQRPVRMTEKAAASAAQDTPNLIAEVSVSDLSNWVSSRARGSYIDNLKRGVTDIESAIVDDLLGGSSSALDRIAMEAARSAVAGGRWSAFEQLGSEISSYAYSAAADQNMCEPCGEADGTEWKTLDDIDILPGQVCEGRDACRCQIIAIFASEGVTTLG
jgi:hypothetical protein